MKSEHRHELKTNELEKLTGKLKPFFEQHGLKIALAVSAVVVVVAGVTFWTRNLAAAKTAGWSELYSANSAESYLDVAEKENLSGKPVADWARLQAAEGYLQTGIQQSLQNREGDRGLVSDLSEARKNFDAVLNSKAATGKMRERALYGLACCLEAMAGVNQRTTVVKSSPAELLAEAIKAYKRFVEDYPDSLLNLKRYEDEKLGRLEQRIRFLESQDTGNFYVWFRTQNPKTKDRRGPFDNPFGQPGAGDGPVMLPPIPSGLRLPDDIDDSTPVDGDSGPALELPLEEKSGDTPAAPDEK